MADEKNKENGKIIEDDLFTNEADMGWKHEKDIWRKDNECTKAK